ncbi:type III secretion protein [Salinicola rhizosphaerae]|uniref:Type III secretion protein n=1 Tax=Salinicola rhizosphaerae TaxID=1443141 RepID=A0ABQ3DR89_9GAMM|nr:type III secretion protein [Salinicola rhizosphaerae]GHB11836.1 type III secretion protein [Salinicola rhizosphaerae]
MPARSWLLALSLAMAASMLVPTASRAAEAPWADRDYRYVVIRQDVRDVLQEFGRNLSLPVEVSDGVEGEVNGDIHAAQAGEFLRKVCEANGLAWFYDGYVLHVAARDELARRVFDLDGIDSDRLLASSRAAEIGEPLGVTLIDGGDRIEVSGPPAWLDSMAQRIDGMRRPTPSAAPGGVTVYRGSVATPAKDGN